MPEQYEAPRVWRVKLVEDDLEFVNNYKYNYCGGTDTPPFEPVARGGSGPCFFTSVLDSDDLLTDR